MRLLIVTVLLVLCWHAPPDAGDRADAERLEMRAQVRDAGFAPFDKETAYLELSFADGQGSVVVMGPRAVALMQLLGRAERRKEPITLIVARGAQGATITSDAELEAAKEPDSDYAGRDPIREP